MPRVVLDGRHRSLGPRSAAPRTPKIAADHRRMPDRRRWHAQRISDPLCIDRRGRLSRESNFWSLEQAKSARARRSRWRARVAPSPAAPAPSAPRNARPIRPRAERGGGRPATEGGGEAGPASGRRGSSVACDVTDAKAGAQLDRACRRFGGVDIVVSMPERLAKAGSAWSTMRAVMLQGRA